MAGSHLCGYPQKNDLVICGPSAGAARAGGIDARRAGVYEATRIRRSAGTGSPPRVAADDGPPPRSSSRAATAAPTRRTGRRHVGVSRALQLIRLANDGRSVPRRRAWWSRGGTSRRRRPARPFKLSWRGRARASNHHHRKRRRPTASGCKTLAKATSQLSSTSSHQRLAPQRVQSLEKVDIYAHRRARERYRGTMLIAALLLQFCSASSVPPIVLHNQKIFLGSYDILGPFACGMDEVEGFHSTTRPR